MVNKLVYNVISTKNGAMGYVKIGTGHPLVMITRYAATLYNWDSRLINNLLRHFTLYLFDFRGVGLSNSTNAPDIDGCVLDISQAIDALGLDCPIVLGWSFGGLVAQHLFKSYRHNISGMVLLSSFPDQSSANKEFGDLSMKVTNNLTDLEKLRLYQLMVSETPTKNHPNRLKESVLLIDDYHYRYKSKDLHNKFVYTCTPSTVTDLQQIDVPTLILNAKNDQSFPESGIELLINNIPNSKLVLYSSGGHLLIHHHGCEIATDIATFFIRSKIC